MEIEARPIKNISAKLVKVMEEVSHIDKNGSNDFHHYKYATAADVLSQVNKSLCNQKICSLAKAELLSITDVVNSKGNVEHLATVKMNIQLIDSISGEWVEISGLGNGQDSGDKAVMKAETASIKYAYMMAFNISTGDDPEADTKTDQFEATMPNYPAQPVQQMPRVNPQARKNANVCSDCGVGITEKVANFSSAKFGKPLCMNCQKNNMIA